MIHGHPPERSDQEEVDEAVAEMFEFAEELPASEERVDKMIFLVHAGYHGLQAVNSSILPSRVKLDGDINTSARTYQDGDEVGASQDITSGDYSEYMDQIYNEVRNGLQSEKTQVIGFFQYGRGEEYLRIMGSFSEKVRWTPSERRTGIPAKHALPQIAKFYNQVEDGGSIKILGEDRDKCYQHALNFLSTMIEQGQKEIELKRGLSYTC